MNDMTKAEMRKRLGNITQLQDLLFGEQIEEYNHKLAQYNQKLNQLESNSNRFQLSIENRLEQLEKNLLDKINLVADSLEKKIKYFNATTQEEQKQIKQDLSDISQHSYENIDFIQNSLNVTTSTIKSEISQSKATLDRDLQLLKQQVFDKLESNLAELSSGKVSRSDLAEVLFELCLKLKGSDMNFELEEAQENSTPIDLILPEKSKVK